MAKNLARDFVELGIAQGLERGHIEMAQTSIIRVLRARFDDVPDGISRAINRIIDLDSLDRLIDKASVVPSMDEFRAMLH